MAKEFKRPSQMKDVVTEKEGVSIDVPEKIEAVTDTNNKFVKYDDVVSNDRVNMFNSQITVKPSGEWLNRNFVNTNSQKQFQLSWLKSLSARVSIYELKSKFNDYIVKVAADKTGLTMEDMKQDMIRRIAIMNSDSESSGVIPRELHLYPNDFTDDEKKLIAEGKPVADTYGTHRLTKEKIDALRDSYFVFKDLRLTKGKDKDKQLLLILDKKTIIKEDILDSIPEVLGGDENGTGDKKPRIKSSLELLRYSVRDMLNIDLINEDILMFCKQPAEIKAYGDDLVLELDPFRMIVQVMLREYIPYIKIEDVKDYLRMSQPVVTGTYFNFLISCDVPEGHDGVLLLPKDAFICARLQVSHEEFARKINSKLNLLAVGSSIVYVKTNGLALQPSGVEALKSQLPNANAVNSLISIPLIKVPSNGFEMQRKPINNPGLSVLMKSNGGIEDLDHDKLLLTYGSILDGKVYPFNISNQYSRVVGILPNYRKLALLAISANSSASGSKNAAIGLTSQDIMKCDVADNGQFISIHISI